MNLRNQIGLEFFLPFFVAERDLETILMEKANKFASLMFGIVQLQDILNFRHSY